METLPNETAVLELNILSEKNRQLYSLSPHVEYRTEQNRVMFYNTLFDTAVSLSLPNGDAEMFINDMKKGVANIHHWLAAFFPETGNDVYKILAHKKVIE